MSARASAAASATAKRGVDPGLVLGAGSDRGAVGGGRVAVHLIDRDNGSGDGRSSVRPSRQDFERQSPQSGAPSKLPLARAGVGASHV